MKMCNLKKAKKILEEEGFEVEDIRSKTVKELLGGGYEALYLRKKQKKTEFIGKVDGYYFINKEDGLAWELRDLYEKAGLEEQSVIKITIEEVEEKD